MEEVRKDESLDSSQPLSMNHPDRTAATLLEYRAILEHAGLAILFTRDRHIYRCNKKTAEIFGWPDESSLLGQSARVLFASDDAFADLSRSARPLLASGQTFTVEFDLAQKNGQIFKAHIVASAIDASNPRDGAIWIIDDITERHLQAKATDRLLSEHQIIFHQALVGILFIRGRIIERCNKRLEEIFGHPAGSMAGKNSRIIYGNDQAWDEAGHRVYAAIRENGRFQGEIELVRSDGKALWCRVHGSSANIHNPEAGSVFIFEDITERRKAIAARDELLEEYALIFDNAMAGISFQKNRVIQRCNRQLETIFGYQPGELISHTTRMLFASDETWQAAGRDVYKNGITDHYEGEHQYIRKDGTPVQIHIIGRATGDPASGDWIWIYHDISARHLAEQALLASHRELEERVDERTAEIRSQFHFLSQLLDAIPSPIFYKDSGRHFLGCNHAFANFLGVDQNKIVGKTVFDISQPNLAERHENADRQLLETAGSTIYEVRMPHADGSPRDVVFHKATFTRPDGRIGGIVGIMLDITERKAMEDRLQLSATVFNSTADGVTIVSPEGKIIAVNRAFTEITGYSESEVLGHNPRILQSGMQDDAFYAKLWATIAREGRWSGEIWNRRKDGSVYPEQLTITRVSDAEGRVSNYVGVFSDITVLKSTQEALDFQAHHDALTGLPNRQLLDDRLDTALQRAHRNEETLAVLFVDLDRFKIINDTLGHHIGDLVLCEVSRRFTALVRQTDTVARLGGDEFIIVIEQVGDANAAARIADKILDDLHRPINVQNHEFFIGASIGIALYPQDGQDQPTLLKHADTAMYRAKDRGRNTFEFFSNEISTFSVDRFRMEADIRYAIERNELLIHFQPQYTLTDHRLVGAEALVRWRHPQRGMVSPGQFIPLAEESGLIVQLGEWILRRACTLWSEWHLQGLDPGTLSVNVSGIEFRRGRIRESVEMTLAATRLPPEMLELEITESSIMNQAENSIQALKELRAMGLQIAIDDFGTGYSSLAYLKRLPLSKLKVDQSFVRGLPGEAEDCAITRAIIALAKSLQLTTIAEGVETQAQHDFLASAQCDEMQGYLLGRPMPAEEFATLLLIRKNT